MLKKRGFFFIKSDKEKIYISKKGLSTIVATLLIILLTLVSVSVVWVVIQNAIKSSSEKVELGQFTLDLQIKSAKVENGNVVVVVVRRNPGQGEFVGMNFVFFDGQNSETIRENISLSEGDTKSFTFTLTQINTSSLKSISVYPIYKLSSGKETIGNIADTFDVPANKSAGGGTGEVEISNFARLGFTGRGREDYRLSTQSSDIVKFIRAIVDPLDVLPGYNQNFTVYVYSPYGIANVTSITKLDNSTLNLNFSKIGTEPSNSSIEIWFAEWIVNDTHGIEYRTQITATDNQGNLGLLNLTWTDSCQIQITHGQTNTLTKSCDLVAGAIEGVDAGNIILNNGVVVNLNGGQLIFNQGYSITITAPGAYIIANSGSFGNGYLYYTDADNDGRAPNTVLNTNSGIRAYTNPPTNDCNDNDGNVWSYGYGIDNDGDGYGQSSYGCNNGAGQRTATLGTDCYDSNASAKPGQTSYFTANRGDGSYDYDCDGAPTKQYTSIGTKRVCSWGGSSCSQTTAGVVGYENSVPDCGNSGIYYLTFGLACNLRTVDDCTLDLTTSESRTEACR